MNNVESLTQYDETKINDIKNYYRQLLKDCSVHTALYFFIHVEAISNYVSDQQVVHNIETEGEQELNLDIRIACFLHEFFSKFPNVVPVLFSTTRTGASLLNNEESVTSIKNFISSNLYVVDECIENSQIFEELNNDISNSTLVIGVVKQSLVMPKTGKAFPRILQVNQINDYEILANTYVYNTRSTVSLDFPKHVINFLQDSSNTPRKVNVVEPPPAMKMEPSSVKVGFSKDDFSYQVIEEYGNGGAWSMLKNGQFSLIPVENVNYYQLQLIVFDKDEPVFKLLSLTRAD